MQCDESLSEQVAGRGWVNAADTKGETELVAGHRAVNNPDTFSG
jgi:hypothetical protein